MSQSLLLLHIDSLSHTPLSHISENKKKHLVKLAIDNQETTCVGEMKPMNRRIMGAGGPDEEEKRGTTSWLKPLLEEEHFFLHCKLHSDSNKSECNMFCLDCINCGALCSLCLPFHKDHRLIQIRRSSYHDVIRANEIQKYLDISSVQTYVINSAKVVFLNERPQPRVGGKVNAVTNTCQACHRNLLDSFSFCSLGCKLAGVSGNSKKTKKQLPGKKRTQIMAAAKTATGTSDSEDSCISISHGGGGGQKCDRFLSPTTPSPIAANYTNPKRKGIPHRAPMVNLVKGEHY